MKLQSKMDDVGKHSPRVTCAKRVKTMVQSVFTGVVCCQVPKFDSKKGSAGQCEGSPGKGDGKENGREKIDQQVVQDHLCELHQNKGAESPDQIKQGALMIVDQHQFNDHPHPNLLDHSSKPQTLQENQHHHHVHLNSPQHFQFSEDAASAEQCRHVHVYQNKELPHPSSKAPVEALLVQENRNSTIPSHLVSAPVLQCQVHRSQVNGAQYRPGTLNGKSTQCSHKNDQDCLAEIEKQFTKVLTHQAQLNQNPHNMHPQTIVHYRCNDPPTAAETSPKTDVSSSEIVKQLDRLANEFLLYKQCLSRHTPPSRQGDTVPRGGYIATLSLRYGDEEIIEAQKQELESEKSNPPSEQCIIGKVVTKAGPYIRICTQPKLDHEGIMNHESTAAQKQCKDKQPQQQAQVVLTSSNSTISSEASKQEGKKNDGIIKNVRHNLFETHLDKLAREYKYYQQLICHRVSDQENAANSSQENKDRFKDQPGQPDDVEASKQTYKPEVKVNTDNVSEINRYLDDLAREYQHCKILVNQYRGFEPTLPVSDNMSVAISTDQAGNVNVTQEDHKPKGIGKDPNNRFYPQVPDADDNYTPDGNAKNSVKVAVVMDASPSSKKENEQKPAESNKAKGKCDRKCATKPVTVGAVCLSPTQCSKEKNEQKQDVKVKCGNVESNKNEDTNSTRKHCRKHHFEDPANFECKSTVRICSLF